MKTLRSTIGNFHHGQRGMSVIELLIASLLSVMVIAAALEFYVTQHRSWLMQQEVSDVQHSARNSLDEIAGRLRMAGFGLTGHPAFEVGDDSLYIYMQTGATVDTILYYVYAVDTSLSVLIRQMPGEQPQVYADGVEELTVVPTGPDMLQVTIVSRAERQEAEFLGGDGYRRRRLQTDVRARNVNL